MIPTTLTFVPGTMCDRRVWAPVWRELNGQFAVGYIPIETRLTREGIVRLFEEAGSAGEPLHLVAFSMGGYLALEYALDNPDRVASLVTVCSSAFGLNDKEKAERARAVDYLASHDYRGIPASRLNQFVHPSHQSDPNVADVIRAMDRDLGKDVLIAQLRETSARVSLAPRLGKLTCPVLMIGCDSDPFLPPEELQRMGSLTPHAETELVKDAGHMLPLEQPAWLAARIAKFHSGQN